MKYLLALRETGSNGPQISVCSSSNGLGALHDLPLRKELLCCLPRVRPHIHILTFQY